MIDPEEQYAEGQREPVECRTCGQPIWIVYHGPASNHTVEPRLGGEDQRLTQALDKLTMVGVGYRARPMPVEDYELVEAAILILRALAGSVGEPDGGEGAEDA